MKIMAIGNSFSEDATRYLHAIAYADRVNVKVVNLYRGGCSLERHYYNLLGDIKDYTYMQNGVSSGLKVSIRDALVCDDWDIVVMQQASYQSFDYSSYQPYLDGLSNFVRLHAPRAKQWLNQTWTYPKNSERLRSVGYLNQDDMYSDLTQAYIKAAGDLHTDMIIPSGLAIKTALAQGYDNVYRDELHVSLGGGRYLLGMVWYGALGYTDKMMDNTFDRFDETLTAEAVVLLKTCALEALKSPLV